MPSSFTGAVQHEPRKPWLASYTALTDDMLQRYGDAGRGLPLQDGPGTSTPELDLFDALCVEAARVTRKPESRVASELYNLMLDPPAPVPPAEEDDDVAEITYYDHEAERRRREALQSFKQQNTRKLKAARDALELKALRERVPPSARATSVGRAKARLEATHKRQGALLSPPRRREGAPSDASTRAASNAARAEQPKAHASDEDDIEALKKYDVAIGQTLESLLRERRRIARRMHAAQIAAEIANLTQDADGGHGAPAASNVAAAHGYGKGSVDLRRSGARAGAPAPAPAMAHGGTARPAVYRMQPSARVAWGLSPRAKSGVRV